MTGSDHEVSDHEIVDHTKGGDWWDSGFVCPVCRETLWPTPNGYWVCPVPGHTNLMSESRASEIKYKIFKEEIEPVLIAQRKAERERKSREILAALDGRKICFPTRIKGVYRLEDSDDLWVKTKANRQDAIEVVRVSKVKRKGERSAKFIKVRPMTEDELTKRIERGDFAEKNQKRQKKK